MSDKTPTTQSVVVPVEPTREMWAAGGTAACKHAFQHHDAIIAAVWPAMLAAAPAPSSLAGGALERAARLIDPKAWEFADKFSTGPHAETMRAEVKCETAASLRIAGEDLAALSPEAPTTGFMATLTDEQCAEALAYNGPDTHPSSLAGGEVSTLVKRLAYGYAIMHTTICHMAGTSGASGRWYYDQANEAFGRVSPIHSITEDSNPHVNGDYFSGLSNILAALSPEAPAREGGWFTTDTVEVEYHDGNGETHMSPWEVDWGNVARWRPQPDADPIPKDTASSTEEDDDDASTYAPSIAGLSDYLWNQALEAESVESRCILEMWREAVDALTPRHEAPASPSERELDLLDAVMRAGGIVKTAAALPDKAAHLSLLTDALNRADAILTEGLNGAPVSHEAPAEGAGEDFYAVGEFIGRQPVLCVHGSTDPNNLCPYCEGEKIWGGRNLRTRSSAPEAREVEAVASRGTVRTGDEVWVRAKASDVCTSTVFVYIDTIHEKPIGSYMNWKDVRLSAQITHPAAPSADKLRAGLDEIERLVNQSGAIPKGELRSILAALKAEDAK